MRRKLALICVVFLFISSMTAAGFAFAVDADVSVEPDMPMVIPIFADGILVAEGIGIDGSTYVSLRSFCETLLDDIEVIWDQDAETACITSGDLQIIATVGKQYFSANERYFYVPDEVFNVDGAVMLPVRELARVFSIDVTWHDDWSVSFGTDKVCLMEGDGSSYYVEDDVYWLSRIINAESGNQPLEGKIGTGNVVINRVADPICPDTIYDVIFDKQHGVQFSPVEIGTIYAEPNEESVIAAKLCLEGYSTVGNSLFFVNPEIGITEWMSQTRTFITSIGDHDFYA